MTFKKSWHHTTSKGQIWDSNKVPRSELCSFHYILSSQGQPPTPANNGFWPGLAHPRLPSSSESLMLQKTPDPWFIFFQLWLAPYLLFLPELNPVFHLSDCSQNDSSEPIQVLYPTLQVYPVCISVMFPIQSRPTYNCHTPWIEFFTLSWIYLNLEGQRERERESVIDLTLIFFVVYLQQIAFTWALDQVLP